MERLLIRFIEYNGFFTGIAKIYSTKKWSRKNLNHEILASSKHIEHHCAHFNQGGATMKKRIIPSVCSGFILSFMTQIAIADDIPTRSLPMSQILQHLLSKGYHTIQEVEFDDGLYEVEALDEQGNQIILRMNPQTGDLIKNQNTQKYPISLLEAAQKIEGAGYHSIYKIESHGSQYEVKALGKEDTIVKLRVDANTGKINRDE